MSENQTTKENGTINLYIEAPDGERFECEVPTGIPLSTLAADFFEARAWPTHDSRGRGQRAVVELLDPENADRTKRLRGEQTVDDAGLWDGAVLRIFPESIAGRVDERARVRALVADHRDMEELVEWHPHITFQANRSHAPTRYEVTFNYRSFRGLSQDGHTPLYAEEHRAEIVLGAQYPRKAPQVRWLTPIFHPNIRPRDGAVCLGVLMDRYLPGMGLARVVIMLAEMVQWRNFDITSALNPQAAQWAADPEHWDAIQEIGGSPFQGPVHEIRLQLEKLFGAQPRQPEIQFKRL